MAWPEMLEPYKEQIIAFLSGPAFWTATAVFFGYLAITRGLAWLRNIVMSIFELILGVFTPWRLRRVFLNFAALVFMVGGLGSAGMAYGKHGGGDGILEGIIASGIMLALWGTFLMVSLHFKHHSEATKPATTRKKKPSRFPDPITK